MDSDHRTSGERHGPSADAFRDSVRNEDPTAWGTRANTAAMPPSEWERPGVATDATTLGATTPAAAPAPVAGDASVASYVPPRTEERVTEREVVPARTVDAEPPVDRPRFSIGATFLGWSVAAFFTLVFSAIALGVAGGGAASDGVIDFQSLALASLVGYLIAAFLAYLIGGYAAGRISLWNGVWHGLGTVAWAVLFAVVAVVAGTYLADAANLGVRFDLSGITGYGLLAIGLSLLAMLAGAALGGRLGERYHAARGHARTHGRRVGRHRVRPQ
ncbi:MAG TPA: hypothetical protein VFH78_12045 [Candidatus Thermoplasmatota archaeon]|nr:hypothetical protein [Candidatus Thermoplasmatota archaeon]